jgi:excisionase family DNA binding protein
MAGFDYSITEGDRLLTVQDVCELLGVKKPYLYNLTHHKKIPHIKIEGILRFRQEEIKSWLDSREVGSGGS